MPLNDLKDNRSGETMKFWIGRFISDFIALIIVILPLSLWLSFLFPKESKHWLIGLSVAIILVGFSILQGTGKFESVFAKPLNNRVRLKEIASIVLLPIGFYVVIAEPILLSVGFVLPVMWLSTILGEFLKWQFRLWIQNYTGKKYALPQTLLWVACLTIAGTAFILTPSLHRYQTVSDLIESYELTIIPDAPEIYSQTGLWFAEETEVTAGTPKGYGAYRNDGLFDFGNTIIYVLSEQIHIPIQKTLQYIICAGLFMLTVFIGGCVLKNPIGLLMLGLILDVFYVLFIFPNSTMRLGQLESLFFSLPFAVALLFVLKKSSKPVSLLYVLLCGVVFASMSIIRKDVGQLFIVYSLLAIAAFTIFQFKHVLFPIIYIIPFVCGVLFVNKTAAELFSYRNRVLEISNGGEVTGHGTFFPLLGGLGGEPLGSAPTYGNQLDMAFYDPVLISEVINYNPLAVSVYDLNIYIDDVSRTVFLDYIKQNPIEFLKVLVYKGRDLIKIILQSTPWYRILFLAIFLKAAYQVSLPVWRKWIPGHSDQEQALGDTLLISLPLFVIWGLFLAPAILTNPLYSRSNIPCIALSYSLISILILIVPIPRKSRVSAAQVLPG